MNEILFEDLERKAGNLAWKCPKCGRFSRVIEPLRQDMNGEWWVRINCAQCGEGATG